MNPLNCRKQDVPPTTLTEQESASLTRQEVIIIAAIFLLGVLCRVLFISDTAIEHFDEGVYASNLWFGSDQGAEYPERYFYAPPLLPFLIEWSMIFLGTGPLATFLPSLLFGILTVPLVWWVARSWFGPAAGLVAAVLASFSDLHLVYSRAALTDIALGFFLLLSVYLIWKNYLSRGWKWPVLAGVAVGAGWSVKYNGWLPLAVGISGMVPWLLIHRRQLSSKTSYLLRWGVVACIAFLVWLPVLIGLQKWGGYSVVAANHRSYVVGFSGWWESISRQILNHRLLEGSLGYLGVGMVCLVFAVSLIWMNVRCMSEQKPKSEKGRSTWNVILTGLFAALPLVLACVLGVSPLLGILGSSGILLQLFFVSGIREQGGDSSPSQAEYRNWHRSLAAWLLAAWFCGLLLATPLYYPYPRLTIPWTISAWLGTAALAGWVEQRCPGDLFQMEFRTDARDSKTSPFIPGVSVVMIVLILVLFLKPLRVTAWQPRNGLALISQEMLSDLRAITGSDSILYVYAEPGLFFNLQAQGHALTGPVADFQFLNSLSPQIPVYLITGPHASTDSNFQQKFEQVRDRFELVKSYDYTPSLLVRMNQARVDGKAESEPVLLYRAK